MEHIYYNLETDKAFARSEMLSAYNSDYFPAVAAWDAPLSFGAWLEEISLCGDYIECPANAAYMVTIDFDDGATFYGPGDVAALAADIAGLIDDYNPADIAGKVWRLRPGGRAYFDFVNVARIQ